jgi:hypothetical protein
LQEHDHLEKTTWWLPFWGNDLGANTHKRVNEYKVAILTKAQTFSYLNCGFHVLGRVTKNMMMFIVKVEFTCVSMNFYRMCNYLYL